MGLGTPLPTEPQLQMHFWHILVSQNDTGREKCDNFAQCTAKNWHFHMHGNDEFRCMHRPSPGPDAGVYTTVWLV